MSQLSSSSSSGGVIKKIKKKLSGATMGMRFMQRSSNNNNKNSSNRNHNHKMSSSSASVDAIAKDEKVNVKNNDNNNNNGDHDNSYQWEMNNTKQQEQNQEQKEELLSSSTTASSSLFLFETASQSDMYGIRSEIIGRRSFNNFNKAVEETYQAAVYSRRQQKLDKKMSREQISDEELLNRYEQYVKGRGDMSGGSGYGGKGKVVNDIGNLKKKRKR